MKEELLLEIIEKLCNNKNRLENADGHLIESIFIDEDYDKDGNIKKGICINYLNEVRYNTNALINNIEEIVNKRCKWYRFSPKGFFLYFE